MLNSSFLNPAFLESALISAHSAESQFLLPTFTLDCDFAARGLSGSSEIAKDIIALFESERLHYRNALDYGGFLLSPKVYLFLYKHEYITTIDYSDLTGLAGLSSSAIRHDFLVITPTIWNNIGPSISSRSFVDSFAYVVVHDTIQQIFQFQNLY